MNIRPPLKIEIYRLWICEPGRWVEQGDSDEEGPICRTIKGEFWYLCKDAATRDYFRMASDYKKLGLAKVYIELVKYEVSDFHRWIKRQKVAVREICRQLMSFPETRKFLESLPGSPYKSV